MPNAYNWLANKLACGEVAFIFSLLWYKNLFNSSTNPEPNMIKTTIMRSFLVKTHCMTCWPEPKSNTTTATRLSSTALHCVASKLWKAFFWKNRPILIKQYAVLCQEVQQTQRLKEGPSPLNYKNKYRASTTCHALTHTKPVLVILHFQALWFPGRQRASFEQYCM